MVRDIRLIEHWVDSMFRFSEFLNRSVLANNIEETNKIKALILQIQKNIAKEIA